LDSYSAERQPIGHAVVSRTRQRSLNVADRAEHDLEALRADSQLYVNYRGSDWVAEKLSRPEAMAAGPRPGDRAPDVSGLRREGVDFPLRLFDLFRGTHHTLLVYRATETDQAGLETTAALVGALRQRCGAHLKSYAIVSPDVVVSAGASDACPTVVDSQQSFRRAYAAGAGMAYLVRPDGYVGFRTDVLQADALKQYLDGIYRS
jgi:hypothetical protein